MSFPTLTDAYRYYAGLLLGPSGRALLQWWLILYLGPWGNGSYASRRPSDRYTAEDYIAEWGGKVGFDPAVAALLRCQNQGGHSSERVGPQVYALQCWIDKMLKEYPALLGRGAGCWKPLHAATPVMLEFGYGEPLFDVERGWYYQFYEYISLSFSALWSGESEIVPHELWRGNKLVRIAGHSVLCLWTYILNCFLKSGGDEIETEDGSEGDGGEDAPESKKKKIKKKRRETPPDSPEEPDGQGGEDPDDGDGDGEGDGSDGDGSDDDTPPLEEAFVAAIEQIAGPEEEPGQGGSPGDDPGEEPSEPTAQVSESFVDFTVCLCQFI